MSQKKVAAERKNHLQEIRNSASELDMPQTMENCRRLLEWISDHIALSPLVFEETLKQAFTDKHEKRVRALINQLLSRLRDGSAIYQPDGARKVLKVLKNNRRFDELSQVADVFISTGVIGLDAESINCELLYVQALIDSGRIHPAILLLSHIESKIKDLEVRKGASKLLFQTAECAGLYGRAYKQLYIDNERLGGKRIETYLHQAIEHYGKIYSDPLFEDYDDRTWHGINIASVARRAEVAGIKLKSKSITSRRIANDVLQIIESRKGTDRQLGWDEGTALEASLLMGNAEAALKRTVVYCRQKDDVFKYASTLRQLEEVLQLDPNDDTTSKILRLLRAMQLKQDHDTCIEIANPKQEAEVVTDLMKTFKTENFEAVFGDTEYKALEWYRLGLERASAVGKISSLTGRPQGTGFLIRGREVDAKLGDELVLITNSHVVSEDKQEQTELVPRSLAPDNASVIFHAVDPSKSYKFKTHLHRNSHRNELDYSILRFQQAPTGIEPVPIIETQPVHDGQQRVYLIGHPQGGGLSFSIQDNRLTGYDPATGKPVSVLYHAPTRAGSSGSPVFDEDWRVFALHHKTKGGNNRGVLFSQIVSAS